MATSLEAQIGYAVFDFDRDRALARRKPRHFNGSG